MEKLSQNKYRNKTKPYLKNIIIDLQNSDRWKIQLTIAINFISSKHAGEERVMHSRSNSKNLHLTMMQLKLFKKIYVV